MLSLMLIAISWIGLTHLKMELALILPIIPIVLAILSFAAAQVRDDWSYAIASALFFGWTIAAVFPLAV
jgi:hypothetical protein